MYKGQAAMEYLMTYGWALLAIVIVIALLLYLNPFQIQEVCVPDPGIDCTNPMPVLSKDGKISFTLKNGLAGAINVTGINCTNVQGAPANYENVGPVAVAQGGTTTIVATNPCIGFQPNTPFQGYVYLRYRYATDSLTTNRTVSARIKLVPQQ
ncbi:MAG: hypothetical protein QXJ06_00855 [Candidatus Aenigmatarchaeota archaeon]